MWPFNRANKPTKKQLDFIRDLAKAAGVKRPKPKTKAEAGACIDVLKAAIAGKADAVRRIEL